MKNKIETTNTPEAIGPYSQGTAGSGMDSVYKSTVFHKDGYDFEPMNEVYEAVFVGSVYPVRSTVEVTRLPKNSLEEIEAITWSGQ